MYSAVEKKDSREVLYSQLVGDFLNILPIFGTCVYIRVHGPRSYFKSGAVKRVLNSLVTSRLVYQNCTEYKFSNPFFREWLKVNV